MSRLLCIGGSYDGHWLDEGGLSAPSGTALAGRYRVVQLTASNGSVRVLAPADMSPQAVLFRIAERSDIASLRGLVLLYRANPDLEPEP